jgi:DHA2 family multidrug resistance protein
MSANVSPNVGKWDFFFPLAIRAIGISMVQLPLINQAVAGLSPKDYAGGIALNNMIRQLGGAFGIALANNYIAKQYAQHRTDLVSKLTDGAAAFTEQKNAITQGIIAKTGDNLSIASTKALAVINQAVDRQAYYLSYLDTFRLITIFFILVIPLVVFLRTKKKTSVEIAESMKAATEAH